MPNHINYRGLKHYPSGNARLAINDSTLHISGLNRTLDGIRIETGGAKALTIRTTPVVIKDETVLGATFNVRDRLTGIRTAAQWVMMQCGATTASLLLNSRPEGSSIQLTAKRQGWSLFTKTYIKQDHQRDHWMKVAVFSMRDKPLTLFNIDYQTGFSYGKQGLITGTAITRAFRCSGLLQGEYDWYEVDELQLTSSIRHTNELPDKQPASVSQVILTGSGLTQFSILDEQYSKAS